MATDTAKIAQWRSIMVTDDDRLVRDVQYYLDLYEWCKTNGKFILLTDWTVIRMDTADERHAGISRAADNERFRLKSGEKRARAARRLLRQGKLGGVAAQWSTFLPVLPSARFTMKTAMNVQSVTWWKSARITPELRSAALIVICMAGPSPSLPRPR